MKDYNIKLVNEDAIKYQIDSKNKPDIIISETMQNALAKEQQVPIFLNLMNQLNDDTLFIPEKIELFIGLKKAGNLIEGNKAKHYNKMEKIFDVSKEAMFPLGLTENRITGDIVFDKRQTIIENKDLIGFSQLLLLTEIQVYKKDKISINESGLTTPIIIKEIPTNLEGSIVIHTQYKISSQPKLDYEII